MRRRLFPLVGLLSALSTAPATAYVPYYIDWNGRIHHPSWSLSQIPVRFALYAPSVELISNMPRSTRIGPAIEAATKSWNIPPVGIRLDGVTTKTDGGRDGLNLITFANTPKNKEIVGDNIAVTPTFFSVEGDDLKIGETDVVFTNKHSLADNDPALVGDIQTTAMHEFGHVLGLLHSPIVDSIMYVGGAPRGYARIRSLGTDDILGMRSLYVPAGEPKTGTISGQVLTRDGKPVLGASVVAVDSFGIVPAGVLTDRDGRFSLPSLPAGEYQVYVEPLVGYNKPSDLFSEYHQNANIGFKATFAGGSRTAPRVRVNASATTNVPTISVEAKAPARDFRYFFWWDGQKWQYSKPQLRAGESSYVFVYGPTMDTAPIPGFSFSGGDISIDGSRVQRDSPSGSVSGVMLPISIQVGSHVGARSLFLETNGELSTFTGILGIVNQ